MIKKIIIILRMPYIFTNVILFFCVNVLYISSQEINSEKTDLLDFVRTHDLFLNWDNNYNIGLIRKDNTIVSFQPNLPVVLINFTTQRFLEPVIKLNGKLLASPDFIKLLDEVLVFQTYKPPQSQLDDTTSIAETTQENQSDIKVISSPSIVDTSNISSSTPSPLILDTNTNFSRVVTLVIDPGHGGKAPGAVGRFSYKNESYRIMEKDIVLKVSLMVRDRLQKVYPNLNIVMTREKDEYISLEDRTIVGNTYLEKLTEGEAMVFVSIHANAALIQSANGYEVWYLPPNYRRDNLISEELSHSQIYTIINNLREEEITLESSRLAELVIQGLEGQIGTLSRKRGVKEEKFYVVRNTKMPAILIELGFVTNPEEGYNLTQQSYRERLSDGITTGLSNYLQLFDQ